MNKEIYAYVIFFSLFSMIGLISIFMLFGVTNDYVMFELDNTAEHLEDSNVITSFMRDAVQTSANSYKTFFSWFDWGWLLAYIIFLASSLFISYYSAEEDELGFIGMLFYGVMILLFMLTILSVLTDWFTSNLLYKIIPDIEGTLTFFTYYLENVGVFSFIHILLLMVVNKIKIPTAGQQGGNIQVVDSDEIL